MYDCVILAPDLEGPNKGGIQCAGQITWEAIRAHCRSRGERAALLSYGGAPPESAAEDCRIVAARTRGGIIAQSLLRDWKTRRVLCWHLGLAKLLPFLRLGPAEVTVALFGIDAWQPLGAFSSYCLRRVDQFLTISDFTWRRFLECNPRFSVFPHQVVHLGIEAPVERKPCKPQDPPAALILGRLLRSEAYKGHAELISVWPRVRARVPGARLWIAGDGDLRPDLEEQARQQGCADSVVFWGRVSEEKKNELLAECRCLAMPSRGEGFGLVYLEAMRLGRPCLVSDQDAGREVVQPPEAGLQADPSAPDAMMESLCRLLQVGPEWDKWSNAARQRYEANFTAAHYQARLLDALWKEPAQQRPSPKG